MASSDEIFAEKMRFLADTERRLRRKLTTVERRIIERVFENVIGQFQASGGAEVNNLTLIDGLGNMYRTMIEPDLTALVKDFGASALKTIEFAERYYKVEVPDGGPILTDALAERERYLRARLGIDKNGNLKPGGYLRAVVSDPSLVDGIRRTIYQAVENGMDLGGIRKEVNSYVKGEGRTTSPLTNRFNGQIFDQLQEADAAVNGRIRKELGLMGGRYQGGMIETTRVFCCERDGMYWTEEEIESWNDLEWSGKKGKPRLFRGGHQCRHQWQWVSTSRLLRVRPDLELVKGKLQYRQGKSAPAFRTGCEERLKEGLATKRKRAAEARKARRKASKS